MCNVLCTVQYTTVNSVHHTVDRVNGLDGVVLLVPHLYCIVVPFLGTVLQVHRMDLCRLFMLRHGVSFTVQLYGVHVPAIINGTVR